MKEITRFVALMALMLLVSACGRNESTASKGAAPQQSAPAGAGHDHSAHQAATATTDTAAMDHSAHAGHDMTTAATDHSAHAGHDMTTTSAADHSGHAGHAAGTSSTMDHSAHGGQSSAHGQHGRAASATHAGHGSTQGSSTAGHAAHTTPSAAAAHDHAAMQHGTATTSTSTDAHAHAQHASPAATSAHAGHGVPQSAGPAPAVTLNAPTSNAEMSRTQPASTLQPDDFDRPVPVSAEEARRAAGGETATADPHAGHSAETIYTCPMHPEVTSTTPGTCPKCGMNLVKKEK